MNVIEREFEAICEKIEKYEGRKLNKTNKLDYRVQKVSK